MGDDVTIVIPEIEEEEQSVEEIGEELYNLLSSCMSRIDNLVVQIGEQNARIAFLEQQHGELAGRVWAEVGHSHEEFALTGHDHDERYVKLEDYSRPEESREKDQPPENQHWYFRRFGE
jgi:hypothetical protein